MSYAIVIGRQFGSGGRQIGVMLAERLGVKCYDFALLAQAADSFGMDRDIFVRADEKRPSVISSLFSPECPAVYGCGNPSSMSREQLYKAQSEVIRRISNQESCVIIGRTADYVLRDKEKMLSVFLHSPIEKRIERIIKRGDVKDAAAAKNLAKKRDKDRESYYNFFTGRDWGKADNYHLSLRTGVLPDEDIAELLAGLAAKRFGLKL